MERDHVDEETYEQTPLPGQESESRLLELERAMQQMASVVQQIGQQFGQQQQQQSQQKREENPSDPYGWMEGQTYSAQSSAGITLAAMAGVAPPLKKVGELIKGIGVYRGVPETASQRGGEDQAIIFCQKKLQAAMNSMIDGYEMQLSEEDHNRRIMTLIRSAFQDLTEIRRHSVGRNAKLEQRPDMERVELFSEKEREDMEKAQRYRSRSGSRGFNYRSHSPASFRGRGNRGFERGRSGGRGSSSRGGGGFRGGRGSGRSQ